MSTARNEAGTAIGEETISRRAAYVPEGLRTGPSVNDRSFIGHPGGLPWMLQVEMWERFSWFGMRAILLYFLTDTLANHGLGLSTTAGQVVVSAYGAAVLLMTIPGGIVADRVLGPWMSTLVGGSVIMAGHVVLAIPSVPTSWVGLILIAIGTGFIKPNLSTVVGGLYDKNDPRRDQGFQYFYMSINVGSLVAPLLISFLRGMFGYHIAFMAAAVGMAFALIAFFYGRRRLGEFAFTIPNPLQPGEGKKMALLGLGIAALAGGLVAFFSLVVFADSEDPLVGAISWSLFIFAFVTALGYFLTMFRSPRVTAQERSHLSAFTPLWVGNVLFVVIFEQAAGKMATFALDNTDRSVFGLFELAPAMYQSFNPLFVLLLAPVLGWLFTRRAGRFPNTAAKFAISLVIIGVSALMMGYGFSTWPGGAALAPFWFLAAVFFVQTVAELFMNPVGLSVTTKLAPRYFASQTMTLWLLAPAVGMGLTSVVIQMASGVGDGVFYTMLGVVTLVVSVGMFVIAPWVQSKMDDIDQREREGKASMERAEQGSEPADVA
ncbi:peptide MFS transporter [Helcobacillus massiliensis]|uniref:peptide MFS transporter n=1 Tax=Helcobacillus massiliensis TaxID=521392 RepID=UPI0025526F07|nr:oligopeptide:H+ symporter [Helcobacillus massiliensis]MDK7742547.1 oligopeptide:H+ symporter [Helcobacillus massiliensis]WOO92291.1 oligopeptide:H+ symporter [Helcobacillus massiliensis]